MCLVGVPGVALGQVTVNFDTNNILISEVEYRVASQTPCNFVQTVADGSDTDTTPCASDTSGNPTPYDVPVNIVRIVGGGEEFLPAVRFLQTQNFNSNVGDPSTPASQIRVLTPTQEINHVTGTPLASNPAYFTELDNVISIPDLRSYWVLDGSGLGSLPANFTDVLFQDPILVSDVIVISERDGNSNMQLTPLDENGDLITEAGVQTVTIQDPGGPERFYQWQTLIGNPVDSTCCSETLTSPGGSNQRQWLLKFNASLFGNISTPIFGYRITAPTGTSMADGKILLYREGLDFGDAPEGYGTTIVEDGARHNSTRPGPGINGPWLPDFDGPSPTSAADNDTDEEANGQPSALANGDTGDELGVVFPSFETFAGGGVVSCDGYDVPNNPDQGEFYYCAAVRVANPTDSAAQVVGWIDFDGDGSFENNCSTDGQISADCERSAAAVIYGQTGLRDFTGTCSLPVDIGLGVSLGGSAFTTGNVPPHCEGVVILLWQYDTNDVLTTEDTYARVRITSDQANGFFSSAGPLPTGRQENGEVEDYLLEAGTLPVSISAFDSQVTRSGLEVSWTTVSETENIGFYIWADTGRSFELLTEKMIPSTATDAVGVNHYSVTLKSREALAAKSLSITAVDVRGEEEMYGLFDVGNAYGREAATAAIPWQSLNAQMDQRLAVLGYEHSDQGLRRNDAASRPVAVDFAVSSEGMQSISFDDLTAAGLDLRGVDPSAIAVTLKGEPVARHIVGAPSTDAYSRRGAVQASVGGSGAEIHFWGSMPGYPDALYVSEYVYRVSVDASKALAAGEVEQARWGVPSPSFAESILVNEDNRYAFTAVFEDPWNAARLSTLGSNKESYSTSFNLPSRVSTRERARIEVVLGGVTTFGVAPDHHVELLVNGKAVAEAMFDGQIEYRLQADLEPGLLKRGENQVTVRLPGGTEAPFDIVEVDTVEVSFSSRLTADNGRILIERGQSAEAFEVRAVANDALAYAYSGEQLLSLPAEAMGRGVVVVPASLGGEASYWVSGRDALHRPALVGAVAPDSARRQAADFVVIAHPAFLPATPYEAHPLNDFVAARQSEGWTVQVEDLADIQLHHGGGMALPEAVTNYLRGAYANGTSHVLLVGGDSYDYHDRLGLGSISHIPTIYRPTERIPHTPSDALLADIDGDGVSDLALGRWPVRSMSDLHSVVSKTLDWDVTTSGLQNSVWVTDTDDPNVASFEGQGERMAQTLVDGGWIDANVDRIHMNDIGQGFGAASDARAALFDALADGRSLTGFVGHGSPSAWTFQSLLFPSDVGDLNNDGYPTLIGTLTCYTSYFVSPHNDTVAHRFMNGYRLDANGEPVFGAPNGAVAVHGAATLSNYLQNEYFAKGVLARQLEGETLGSAVLAARQEAAERGIDDLVVNWTLLGDPTLRMVDE